MTLAPLRSAHRNAGDVDVCNLSVTITLQESIGGKGAKASGPSSVMQSHSWEVTQCTIALELSKVLKCKCPVFAQFLSKYDNSSSDW